MSNHSPLKNRILLLMLFVMVFLSALCLGAAIYDLFDQDLFWLISNLITAIASSIAATFIYFYLYR